MTCHHLPGGGIACSRGKAKPTKSDLEAVSRAFKEMDEERERQIDEHRRKG